MGNRTDVAAIEIDRRVAEALAATAAARGLSLEDFLREVGGSPTNGQAPPDVDPDEFDRWLD